MFFTYEGIRVYYEIRGTKGSGVALLHGWGCSGEMMERLAEALEAEHRVLVLDFPGHGRSDRPPEPWGVPEFAGCLEALLAETEWTPCAVVGHSFGCRVAACAASERPELFTRMVFTGAAGLKPPPTEEGKRRAKAFQRGKRLAQGIKRIPALRAAGARMEEKLRQKYGSRDYNALDEEMRKTFVKVISLDLRDRYPEIRQPTLLIWGDADTETPLWMGQEMEKLIPDAGLVILEGGSHFAFLEQAARFQTIVLHFLKDA